MTIVRHRTKRLWLWRTIFLPAFFLLLLLGEAHAVDVKIATFNIQNLGMTKVGKPAVLRYLGQVIRKFDIVAVQEVSDSEEQAPFILLDEVNRTGRNYGIVLSERTGKQVDDRTSQEQYAFYYNADRIVSVDDGRLFKDSGHDYFQREPFSAEFAVVGTTFGFTISSIHTQPEAAVEEIGALFEVYEDLLGKYPDQPNHVILGDFNGDCSYASPAQLDELEIRDSSFTWIVPDNADTNLAPGSACAYDRIVTNEALQAHYKRWGIANWFSDKTISDHWPVWVTFRSN